MNGMRENDSVDRAKDPVCPKISKSLSVQNSNNLDSEANVKEALRKWILMTQHNITTPGDTVA